MSDHSEHDDDANVGDDTPVDANDERSVDDSATEADPAPNLPPFPGFTRVGGKKAGKGWKIKSVTEGESVSAAGDGTDGDMSDEPGQEPAPPAASDTGLHAGQPAEGEPSEVVEAANITIEEEESEFDTGEIGADGAVDEEDIAIEIEEDVVFDIDDDEAAWVLTTEDGSESWAVEEADGADQSEEHADDVQPMADEPDEPEAPAADPEPEEPADPEPEAPAADPEPEAPAADPEPEPEPEAPAADPEPEVPAADPEPEAPAADPESEPEAPAADPEPEAPAAEPEPEAPAAKPEPEAPAAEPEPEAPAAEADAPADDSELDVTVSIDVVQDLLEETAEIAHRAGLKSLQREVIEDRIPALHAGRITLVVLGEFNHGKSTVVNALLGEEVLPMGITPTTAVITHLVHGDQRRVLVQPPMDGEQYEIEADEMADVVKHSDEDSPEPEYVEIQHPNDFLDGGLTLVDTPGVNDISKQKVEITYGYLPRADVILYVLDATQVLKKSEVTFIRDRLLKANRDRIIFVLGKIDALDPADAEEVELYARERLEALIGPVELYAFSGREALRAVKRGEEPPAPFVAFRDSITEFLRRQRNYIILDSALGGGLRVASLLEQNLAVKKSGLSMEADELQQRVTAVRVRLNESRQLISDNLDLIDDRVGGIAATARHNLRSFSQKFREALPVEIERADARDVKRHLPTFIQDTFKSWLEAEGEEVAGNLEELAEEIIEITNASIAETLGVLRDELGVSGDLDLEVDTMAYDVSVFALGAVGVAVLFANAIVGGLLTLAAPVLAFFLRDRVDAKVKERAREEGDKAIARASDIIEDELVRMIQDYGDRLKSFVETAGDRLFRQIEEALAEVQRERAESDDLEALLAETEEDLAGTRRVANMMKKARERLASES